MNETQTHFVAVCPHCSTSLRVRREFHGQQVRCKRCDQVFLAEEAVEPGIMAPGEEKAIPPNAPPPQEDRLVMTCPSCQTPLSIRRAYIGRQVRCKQCDHPFLVQDPATGGGLLDDPGDRNGAEAPTSDPKLQAAHDRLAAENQQLQAAYSRLLATHDQLAAATEQPRAQHDRLAAESQQLLTEHDQLQAAHDQLRTEHDRVKTEYDQLQAEHGQVKTEHGQLQAEHDRVKTEYDQFREQLNQVSADREAIRAELGEIAPADVRPLAEERTSLRAEVDRLRDDIRVLHDEQSTRDLAAGERERQWEADLGAARAEAGRLAERLKQREDELETARTEQDRLGVDRQHALEEAERLRTALAEHESVIRDQVDQLRAETEQLQAERDRLSREIEHLRHSLDQAEQTGRDEQARLNAELASLAERHRQLQDQHEATKQACKDYQERNQELREDLARLRVETPAVAEPAGDDELQSARSQLEDLRRQLTDSERLKNEMAAILVSMGIRVRES
jgi:predicted Zn finger-like uncharacterized protein